jgi:hypothetical protein
MITPFIQQTSLSSHSKESTMSKFVHLDLPQSHAGAQRIENAIAYVGKHRPRLSVARLQASLLVAAIVAALLLAANQLIETVTEGHLFAAWIGLWAVGFAAMALFAQPASRLAAKVQQHLAARREARRAADSDRRFWQAALDDARVMADIRAAMLRANV